MRFFKVTLACLLAVGLFNFADTVIQLATRSDVYVCSDKESNPPDIQKQCERLTKGQWWHK